MTPALHAVRGRPVGRKRAGGPLHAVPADDRTRTALCGARVGGALRTWPAQPSAGEPVPAGTCAECASLVGSVAGADVLAESA